MQDMESMREKYKVNPKKVFKFDMSNFLQKFSMYKGIQQFYLNDLNKEKKRNQRYNLKTGVEKKIETVKHDGLNLV